MGIQTFSKPYPLKVLAILDSLKQSEGVKMNTIKGYKLVAEVWISLNLWSGHTNSLYTCDQYQPITAVYHFIFSVRLADISHMYMN